ncbi:MAG: efflux RND transporter periplasmic adaptor subunit [Synergistaceae bacterium]|nr:efflux RND transporter periplasmic adaptor subunit [Synergistaceae bacterium]
MKQSGMKQSGRGGKVLVFLAAVIAVIAGVGVYSYRGSPAGSEEPAMEEESPAALVRVEVARDDHVVRESIVQNMSIEAVNRVKMIPRVTGRLERLHVKQGDSVTAGQIIATLEHDQQDAQIGAAEAQAASAKADSERARAEMMNAKTNLDRYERLVEEGFSTRQQYDSVETAYMSALASYNAARAKERQVAAELGRARSSKQDYIMYSPLDGTVLSDFSISPGAMIQPSSPIADIADLRRLKASLRIPENKIFVVKPGMDVLLKFDALPNEEFMGQVTRVDPFVDPATRTSAVEIELDNQAIGNRLRPGMFGQASIVEKEFKNSVIIPESALGTREGGYYVFLEENGTARRVDVETGARQGDYTRITGGIKSGDRVIVFGGASLSDGEKVETRQSDLTF